MEETFKPFKGWQLFWVILSGVLVHIDEQSRTPPEEWTTTDWDAIGKDLLGQINNALDLAMPSEANYYDPNYDYESLPNETRIEIDEANRRTKITIAEQKQEAAQAWAELRTNAQKVSSDNRSAYWDGIRHFARTAKDLPLHSISQEGINAVVLIGQEVILNTHIRASSEKIALAISNALSRGEFSNDPTRSIYPSVDLSDGDLKAHAEIRPPEALLGIPEDKILEIMNAIAAGFKKQGGGTHADDIGKVLMYLWHKNKAADGWATVELNDLCETMGLKKRNTGWGFEPDQRDAIRSTVNKLESVSIFLHDLPDNLKIRYGIKQGQRFKASDPYLIIRNRYTPVTGQRELFGQQQKWESITFQPGAVIKRAIDDAEGANRHTMLVPHALTKLDGKRYGTPKLLGNRLIPQFRIKAKHQQAEHPFRVTTLLDYAMLPADIGSEQKLAKALDTLQATNTIKRWTAELTLEQSKADRGGVRVAEADFRKWLNSMILIEPPDQIAEHYAGIGLEYQRRLPAPAQPGDPIGTQLKRTRADRGLTYEQAAEQIGLAVGTLSNIENGSNPRAKTAEKIRQWIAA